MYFFFLENKFFLIRVLCYFSTLKNIEKCPLHLLVKWEVVSPNSREGQLQSISIIFIILVVILYFKWGGGGRNVFLTFYAISNISRRKKSGNTK